MDAGLDARRGQSASAGQRNGRRVAPRDRASNIFLWIVPPSSARALIRIVTESSPELRFSFCSAARNLDSQLCENAPRYFIIDSNDRIEDSPKRRIE